MVGKGGKKGFNATPSMTLREQSTGKKQGKINAKTMCKVDHLKNLAVWAATEASIPSLAAFFGERLAATTEALGIRIDPSLFFCGRCESILQPGDNCTVRIEANKLKGVNRCKKTNDSTQTYVYKCHSCSHRNMMRGKPKGYVKEICPPAKPEPTESAVEKQPLDAMTVIPAVEKQPLIAMTVTPAVNKVDTVALPTVDGQNVETSSPETPLPPTGLSLLDSKRRKRNRPSVKKVTELESSATTADAEKSKRRKKSWTSLKEIAESRERDTVNNKLPNLSIPFIL